MIKKQNFVKFLMKILHKIARYTKEQKKFVIYLIFLGFCIVVLPVVSFSSIDKQTGYSVWLLSKSYFTTFFVIFISLMILLFWNMSFRFKNLIISVFGFKENEELFNLGFLLVITSSFLSIGDTVKVVQQRTMTIDVTWQYYLIQIVLIMGVVLTLLSVWKRVKSSDKARIVNIVDDGAIQHVKNKISIRGLFDDESKNESKNNFKNNSNS